MTPPLLQRLSVMSDRVELQRLARLIEVNRQRLQQVEDQIGQLDLVIRDHEETEASIAAIKDSDDSMIPLGAGVHLRVPQQDKVVIDLGSGIFAERGLNSAIGIMQNRQKDLQGAIDELMQQKDVTEERIRELATTFEAGAREIAPEKVEEITGRGVPAAAPVEDSLKQKRKRGRGFGGELTLDD